MKIVSISTIKNEADIIESFVRYHLNIVDLMIILDNGSTDDTSNILNGLINEGLPIKVILDTDKYFEPKEKYNFLLDKAINEFDADIICPIDADEFIVCDDSNNPRKYIEEIPDDVYFTAMWKTYVPTKNDDETELFTPSRIKYVRDQSFERDGKVILTKELVKKYNAVLSIGNHKLEIPKKYRKQVNNIKENNLKIAHIPLRTIKQTMSKVLTNYPNSLARKVVNKNNSHHYTVMFKKIKENGKLNMEDVTDFATQYSLRHNKGFEDDFNREINVSLIKDPINLNYMGDVEIKYKYVENPLANLLENTIFLASEIHNFKNQIPNDTSKNKSIKKEDRPKVIDNKQKSVKSSFMEKLLNKSNSYVYYKNCFNTLTKNNKKLHNKNKKLHNKNKKLHNKNKELSNKNKELKNEIKNYEQKIKKEQDKYNKYIANVNKLDERVKNMNSFVKKEFLNAKNELKINDELKYAFVFNDTIKESEWLIKKDFSLINSAANYSLVYALYRILNDAKPKNILELGLGQTTKITTQYAKYFKDVKLSVLEGDANWIEVFSKNLDLSENVNIIPMDLETFTYDDSENIRFKGVNDAVKNEKFDFIIIDGPQGYIDNDNGRKLLKYSRTNVWELIPDNLADDFIIIIDDYERDGEKNTFNRIEDLLKEQGIEYYTYYSKGFNEQCALFTEKYKFISWI